jgi:hypothetical protein
MSEARLSALVVAGLTGVGLAMIFSQAFRDIQMGLMIGAPVAVVMGAVLALFASDDVKKKSGGKPQQD